MPSALLKEIRALRQSVGERRSDVPSDPVEFALSVGLNPDAWQRDVLRSGARQLILNCSRQSGKSTLAALLALHTALTKPASLSLILGPSERQAKETFGKAAAMYRTLGKTINPSSYRRMGLELDNGARIEALPGTEKTVRGFSDVDLLVVDEASRIEDGLYYAITPMLAVSGGRLLMMSTPYGKRGVFYEVWTEGADWERFEIRATDVPHIPDDFLEAERQSMPTFWFEQEYECKFVETSDQLFTEQMIRGALDEEVEPLQELREFAW
jgi:hypothetical protein